MRALLGLFLLAGAALFGIESLTTAGQPTANAGTGGVPSALLTPGSGTFGGVVQTVAATQAVPLPPVTAAPDAPRAAPIDPIVAPIKKVAPKVVAPSAIAANPTGSKSQVVGKSKAAKAVAKVKAAPVVASRPGFKLSCTSTQKLDVGRQKCVPVKGQSTATANVAKA